MDMVRTECDNLVAPDLNKRIRFKIDILDYTIEKILLMEYVIKKY